MTNIQIKRGLKTNLPTLASGEFALCTDTLELFIGSPQGNILLGSPSVPSDVTNLKAASISSNSLSLSWDASTGASSYDIYEGNVLLATITSTLYDVQSLLANTAYSFKVIAKNPIGSAPGVGSGATMTTTTAPADVTGLDVGNITSSTLNLSWTASTGATSYDIYKGNTLLGNTASTSFPVSSLSASTLYTFKVISKNATGASSGVTVSASTIASAPNAVTNLAVTTTGITAATIPVTWTAPSGGTAVANYEAAYAVNGGSTYTVASSVVNSSSISFTFTGLNPTTNYTLRIVAIDGNGNRSQAATVTAVTSASLSPVTNLTAGTPTSSAIPVSWTDSISPSIVNYEVAYSTNGSNYSIATSSLISTDTNYTITGLFSSTNYTIRVVGIDSTGTRSSAVTTTATTAAVASPQRLYLSGQNYSNITTPTFTYDEVVVDFVPVSIPTTDGMGYIFSENAFAMPSVWWSGAGTISFSSGMNVTNNGTALTNGTSTLTIGARQTLDITLASPTSLGAMFFIKPNTYADPAEVYVYDIKMYSAGVLVAHYDFTTGSANDQTSNGRNATVLAGTYLVDNTTGADIYTPYNISNPAITNLTNTSFTATWAKSKSNDVSKYNIYQATTLIGTVNAPTVTYNITGLSPAQSYTFTITSVDSSGNESLGYQFMVTTTGGARMDAIPPVSSNMIFNVDYTNRKGSLSNTVLDTVSGITTTLPSSFGNSIGSYPTISNFNNVNYGYLDNTGVKLFGSVLNSTSGAIHANTKTPFSSIDLSQGLTIETGSLVTSNKYQLVHNITGTGGMEAQLTNSIYQLNVSYYSNGHETDTLTINHAATANGSVTVTLNGVATTVTGIYGGTAEVETLTIQGAATSAGKITIGLNGSSWYTVTLAAGDTPGAIGDKIRATSMSGWTVGGTAGSATVTFTKSASGTCIAPTFRDTDSTGATATFATTIPGVNADSTSQVADKIRAFSFPGWTTGGTPQTSSVTFTSNTTGTNTAPSFSGGTTGVTGTISATFAGCTPGTMKSFSFGDTGSGVGMVNVLNTGITRHFGDAVIANQLNYFVTRLHADGTCDLMLNNYLISSRIADFQSWYNWFSVNDMYLGGWQNNGVSYVDVYNRALTDDELQQNYNYRMAQQPLQSVSVSPASVNLSPGSQQLITVSANPAYYNNLLSNSFASGNAGFVTVDSNGLMTGVADGETNIQIISTYGGQTFTNYVNVTIGSQQVLAPAPSRTVTGITMVRQKEAMYVGDVYSVMAYTLPYDIMYDNILLWSTSNPTVARINEGVLQGIAPGTATITASDVTGAFTTSFDVTVSPAPSPVVITNAQTYTVPVGAGSSYGIYNDGTNASSTTLGIRSALSYASSNGYLKIVFPSGTYAVTPDVAVTLGISPVSGIIQLPTNMTIDFSGSSINIQPNAYSNNGGYAMIMMVNTQNTNFINANVYGENATLNAATSTEDCVSFVMTNTYKCNIDNCTFNNSPGFNFEIGASTVVPGTSYAMPSYRDFVAGNIDAAGADDNTNTSNCFRTSAYYDISGLGSWFLLGYTNGYSGYPYLRSRLYDIYFYDANKVLVTRMLNRRQFYNYDKPAGVKYARIVIYQSTAPTTGDGDYNDAVALLISRGTPKDCIISNCTFSHNFSTGIAAGSCDNVRITNCTFSNNGGRMPGCDIDSEDGWESAVGYIMDNNTFSSNLSVNYASSQISALFNNKFNSSYIQIWSRTTAWRAFNNTFAGRAAGNTTLGTQEDSYFDRNSFTGGATYSNGFGLQHQGANYSIHFDQDTVS